MSAHVRVVQRGFGSQGSCLEVSCKDTIILINVPEILQRAAVETKLRFSKVEAILFTSIHAGTIQGYPDLIMTIADLGEGSSSSLMVVGPPPLLRGQLSFVTTLYRPDFESLRVTQISDVCNDSICQLLDDEHKEHFPHCFPEIEFKHGFKVKPIYLRNINETEEKRRNASFRDKFRKYNICHAVDVKRDEKDEDVKWDVLCYAICAPSIRNLDCKKAISLGVPKGPAMGKLSKGESVVTPSGKTVHPEDCMLPEKPGKIILIIDCPDESFLEPLRKNSCLNNYYFKSEHLSGIVHLAPSRILLRKEYYSLFQGMDKNVIHDFVFPSTEYFTPIYIASNQLQQKLRDTVGEETFPHLYETLSANISGQITSHKEFLTTLSSMYHGKLHIGDVTSTFRFHPPKQVQFLPPVDHTKIVNTLEFSKEQQFIEKPRVVFLGTAASVVSRYRGVSSLLLETESGTMLIDAGSGTYSQMVRLFGITETHRLLRSLKCVWLSHKHADHCQGILQLLVELKELQKEDNLHEESLSSCVCKTPNKYVCPHCKLKYDHDTSNRMHIPLHKLESKVSWDYQPTKSGATLIPPTDTKPIVLIGPMWIQNILNDYSCIDSMEYQFVDAQDVTTPNHPLKEFLTKELGIESILGVPMFHSYPTYGVVVTGLHQSWKFAYSADSRPWERFIEAGKNATLLVHECTFDDEAAERAKKTSHSTIREAIDVASQMNAQYLAITHFSTRFKRASFPDITEKYFQNHPELQNMFGKIIPAFDFMFLPLSSVRLAELASKVPLLSQLDLQ